MAVILSENDAQAVISASGICANFPTLFRYPCIFRKYARGEMIFLEGTPVDSVKWVLSGRTKAYKSAPNGRRLLFGFFEGITLMGEVELSGDGYATSSVEAVQNVVTCEIPLTESIKQALLKDDAFLREANRELSRKLDCLSRNSTENLLYPLEHRLAAYILNAACEGVFRENLTTASEMLGASYRHLMRTMGTFQKSGALTRTENGFRIEETLKKYVQI